MLRRLDRFSSPCGVLAGETIGGKALDSKLEEKLNKQDDVDGIVAALEKAKLIESFENFAEDVLYQRYQAAATKEIPE